MAKTLVEKKICDACGADVRPNSLFCYNCGNAVSEELPAAAATNNSREDADVKKFQSDLAETSDLKTTQLKREPVEAFDNQQMAQPIGKPIAGSELFEKAEAPLKVESEPLENPSIQDQAKLKSAANMRRKAKSFQRKTVEVVWEEPENAPNKWFPLVAIFLILLVVGIYYLAMYLK